MLLLFAAAPALVPCPSVSSPDDVIAPALVPCPSASALTCRRCFYQLLSLACQRPLACSCPCAGSYPSPVSVCPRLPLLLPPALVPCPSASPCLPLLLRRVCPLPISIRPCLQTSSSSLPPPPTAADAPGGLSSSAAILTVLPPPLLSLQPLSSSAATIIVATKPSSPPPPPPISCFWGKVPFHVQRN